MDDLTRLFLAARDGDRLALTAAIRASEADVWRFTSHLVGREDADDVTQDTFVRAWRALPSFRAESGARTWLLAIARRASADAVRRTVRGRRLVDRFGQNLAMREAAGPERADLESLVAGLDVDRRAAFVLTQILGYSYAEAAEVCDVKIGTIRSRTARAREQLVEALRAAEAV